MIEVGDHVTIAKGGVHWVVEGFEKYMRVNWANLRSPMSGRRRREPVVFLDLHSKGAA